MMHKNQKKKGLPIVFIHKGNSDYLYYSISHARKTNPNSPIYFIGTKETTHYKSFISHFSIENYFEQAEKLTSIYKHFSTNTAGFELFCLQRWFVLMEFMQKEQINECVYIDSDILVYDDLTVAQENFRQFGMTFSGFSPHTNFVSDVKVLEEFCKFITSTYTQKNAAQKLEEKYNKFIKLRGAGGISDMTFFYDFHQLYPDKLGNITQIHNNTTFDITINTLVDYENNGDIKKISWKNGKPFCKHIETGNLIMFYTLHFQGAYKKLMPKYYKHKSLKFYFQWIYFRVVYYAQKIFGKL